MLIGTHLAVLHCWHPLLVGIVPDVGGGVHRGGRLCKKPSPMRGFLSPISFARTKEIGPAEHGAASMWKMIALHLARQP